MADTEPVARVRELLGDEKIVALYEEMLLIRRFEERAGRAYQQGKIKGFCHLYIGQEALGVGAIAALEERDYVVSHYREHGHAISKGISPESVMAELFGKVTGVSGGKGGSMHLFSVANKFYGGWGIVGGHIPTAAGIAFAAKYREENAVCICFLGDGALHQGAVHETFNMAQLWGLPVVFIIENNKYAMGTSVERASAVTDLSKKALAYDMAHDTFDGQDLFGVYEGVKRAVDRARDENLPTLLNIETYRFRGHSMSDPAKYRSKDEVTHEQERDPIQVVHNWLVDEGVRTDEQLGEIDKAIKARVKAAEKQAGEDPQPPESALYSDVYVSWPFDFDGRR